MEELRSIYLAGLTPRIEALEEAAAEGSEESKNAALRIAHTLRGSGATYGFPEITEAAGAVEDSTSEEYGARLMTLLALLKDVVTSGQGRPLEILLVEDDTVLAGEIVRRLESPGRRVSVASSSTEASQILARLGIGLVILDLVLPDRDGRNLLLQLKGEPATAHLPVVVISALSEDTTRRECLALGAESYFAKPIDFETLEEAVATTLQRSVALVQELRRDPLTGLANRVAFGEAFGRAQALASRVRAPLTLALLDIDNFKAVNDTYGHEKGDEVLRTLSRVLIEELRRTDVAGRWGGEEFVILFQHTSLEGAARALRKTQSRLLEEIFDGGQGASFGVTFSAGVAEVSPRSSLQEAIGKADLLMYRAKKEGRNRVVTSLDAPRTRQRTVLLAEDDDTMAQLITSQMDLAGLEVVRYENGLEALLAAQRMQASLVILDVNMPGMEGFEVLERLRALPAYRQVPMVMVTARGNESDILRGFELGADDYIVKPFSPSELSARIRRLLRRL